MRITLLAMWLLSGMHAVVAQADATRPELNYRGKSYFDHFTRTLRYPSGVRESCATRVAFTTITFQIDERGRFAFLNVEGSVSDSIKGYLRTEFARTSGHWAVSTSKGKPVKSEVYVQPILFRPSSGCNYLTDYDKAMNLLIAAAQKKQVVLDVWHFIGYYDDNPVKDSTGMFNK